MGNKSSGFVPPSLREMLRPKGGTNLQNISSLRSSKNTSMQNTGKQLKEPDSSILRQKNKEVVQKKSDFILQCYSKSNSGTKKGSYKKSASKRELMNMSVLSEHRNKQLTN